MSGFKLNNWDFSFVEPSLTEKDIDLQLITENKIKKALMEEINNSQNNEEIKISIFFFSDRDIIKALLDASERGVDIKIIADPSKFAFGRDNFGVPTRMVINELIKKSKGEIEAKYYDTEAEQFHTKMSIFVRKENISVIVGSANYTRKNLDNFNLESDLKITIPIDKTISKDILDYFDKMWNNIDGKYTISADSFEEPSFWRNIQYRFQEFTGMGTF
jgi:HKD family nuclease